TGEAPLPDARVYVFEDWTTIAKIKDCAYDALATIFTARIDAALLDSKVRVLEARLMSLTKEPSQREITRKTEEFFIQYSTFIQDNTDARVSMNETSVPRELRKFLRLSKQ